MKKSSLFLLPFLLFLADCTQRKAVQTTTTAASQRWTSEQANAWYAKQPWPVGANYLPRTAINQLEMWQAETFDLATIDQELGWAESLGMNTMRIFLHDLAYEQNPAGFLQRIDQVLEVCARHNIRPMIVLFDSVWDPNPKIGKQRDPKPHTHNSGWVQNPGAAALQDPKQYPRLEKYVKAVVARFARDPRVHSWDLWNEPDNKNGNDYAKQDPPNKVDLVLPLLKSAFAWARSAGPVQPLTSGVWKDDWSSEEKLGRMEKLQLAESDIITFHNYSDAQDFEKRVLWLKRYNRPLICTEYMARPVKSTFQDILPICKKHDVGAINWGFVDGKSQTKYPWDSWEKPYTAEPDLWFHDIFRADGTPYRAEEVALIRQLTGVKSGK
jgi:hypothetical protein